mgnify:CR=1 FL=1
MTINNVSEKNVEELDTEIEKENAKKIEAALFISGRFMSVKELITVTDINPILIKKIISDLKDKYKESGLNIIEKDNSWKMDVSQDHVWMVNRLATGSSEFTKAEQQTLAIIAYKHPIKQSVIIKIRGNKAYDHIKKFVDINLINKKKTGHTSELSLSDKFYEYFSLTEGDKLEESRSINNNE